MRRALAGCVVLLAGVVLVAGCGRKSQRQKAAEKAAEQMEKMAQQMSDAADKGNPSEAIEAMQKAAEQMQSAGAKVELVDFRQLKELLPEKSGSLKRTNISGEKSGAMGFSIAMAEASYENGNNGSADVKITDLGGMAGMAAMAQFGWATVEIDRETENGYEKTVKFAGYKGYEEGNKDAKSCRLQIIVKNRFMVEANGQDIDVNDLKGLLTDIPLKKLEGMAK